MSDLRLNPINLVSSRKPYIRPQIQLKNQTQPLHIQTEI